LSSATIYRHFSSRDHLIIAAFLDWIRGLPAAREKAGASGLAGVQELLRLTCVALTRSPNFGRAVVRAMAAGDVGVAGCRQEVTAMLTEVIRRDLSAEQVDVEEYLLLLGCMWQGALLSWAHGRLDMAVVQRVLARGAEICLTSARRDPQPLEKNNRR
jgi:TetR/AcrR family transcriptional regulator, cholesterol catabolism regulator